jgi:hypothetical protein
MIDEFDAACVVAAVFNKEEPEDDEDIDALDDLLLERFGIDLPNFAELVERLLPLCAQNTSPLTGIRYRGFIHPKHGHFIVKTEA